MLEKLSIVLVLLNFNIAPDVLNALSNKDKEAIVYTFQIQYNVDFNKVTIQEIAALKKSNRTLRAWDMANDSTTV